MNMDEYKDKVSELSKDKDAMSQQIEKNKSGAEDLLKDKEKLNRFLERLEKKLSKIPIAGKYLSDIPVLVSLVKAYVRKEYTEIPLGSIIAIISALIYFLYPIDIIPDFIPMFGYADDAAVIVFAYKMVHDDVDEFKIWREANK